MHGFTVVEAGSVLVWTEKHSNTGEPVTVELQIEIWKELYIVNCTV